MIYLDYNATAPYSPKVQDFIKSELKNHWFNASSEYPRSALLAEEIKTARATIAEFLNCSSKSLVFTSGATESINTVLSIDSLRKLGIFKIISSPMEHLATLDRLKYLRAKGFEVEFVPNDQEGVINLLEYENALGKGTLSTFLAANNETGVINPIGEMAELAHKHGGFFHTDAVQALGKNHFDLEELNVDFASFSGHKIGSLKGIGLLYARDIRNLSPLLHGGGQERSYRPGTLNFAGIKSFALAVEDCSFANNERLKNLKDDLESRLKKIDGFTINCESSTRLSNTTSLRMKGRVGREILFHLSRNDIYVSTGSACSSGSFEPSHVMKSLGLTKEEANSCIRISIGRGTSHSEIENFIASMLIALN